VKPLPHAAKETKTRRIGWREHIALPDLGIASLPAKIDTGARTSALHAVDQKLIELDGAPWIEFTIPVHNRRSTSRVRARLLGTRDIKNTGGIPERRYVIRTTLGLGRRRWLIDVSLADRERMEFDLILGRTAIRKRGLLVDPGHSYLLGWPGAPKSAPKSAAQPAPKLAANGPSNTASSPVRDARPRSLQEEEDR